MKPIPAFAINLKKRTDRYNHIRQEFEGKDEFNLTVIEAIEDKEGAAGLWKSIIYILQNHVEEDDEYILICEDDHQFTEAYSAKTFRENIANAKALNADVLLGGISFFSSAIFVSEDLFWIQMFMATQFMVIYKKFVPVLLSIRFKEGMIYAADYNITTASNRKFVTYPFISTQVEFGYSDVTKGNDEEGFITSHFSRANETFQIFRKISLQNYLSQQRLTDRNDCIDLNTLSIPTYIINLPERTDRRKHILKQFAGKEEFDVTVVEACQHTNGALGLWLSIRKIIELAVLNGDDVIIISEDDHMFTKDYTKEYLLKNILEAHEQGADMLSGGPSAVGHVLPITENRYWVSSCLAAQFIVLFKKFFTQILEEPYGEGIVADIQLSEIAANKMILYPLVSYQMDFGYSDVTQEHNENPGVVQQIFYYTEQRLEKIREAYCYLQSQQAGALETFVL